MFVDRVIEHLENAVMQTALIGVADIHSRPFPDRFEPLQFIDLGGVVFLACGDAGGVGLTFPVVGIFVLEFRHRSGSWHMQAKR